jgi:hypothetical protein
MFESTYIKLHISKFPNTEKFINDLLYKYYLDPAHIGGNIKLYVKVEPFLERLRLILCQLLHEIEEDTMSVNITHFMYPISPTCNFDCDIDYIDNMVDVSSDVFKECTSDDFGEMIQTGYPERYGTDQN